MVLQVLLDPLLHMVYGVRFLNVELQYPFSPSKDYERVSGAFITSRYVSLRDLICIFILVVLKHQALVA
jgi:hypothetical protein